MAVTLDEINVLLDVDTSKLNEGLATAESRLKSAGKRMESVGRSMTKALTAPVALAGGAGVAAFAEFEQQLIELQKVTSQTQMEELRDPIQELSNRLPQTASELAGLAADAGRFGVSGTENILAFTESVSKMATATNLSTDEAGQAFAKLATLTDTPIPKVENLGSSINALSNQMATSSQEIVDSMLRSSGALTQLGASNTEVVALNATMNEVSESSRRAGTRLRRLAQEMLNPKKAEDLAAALGMSVTEFQEMRNNSPVRLIRMMAQAMNEGGAQANALRKNLSTTSRQALSGLSQNLEGLNQGLETSGTQFQENTSLQREFDAAMGSLVNQARLLWGQIKNVGIQIGSFLVPMVRRAVAGVQNLISEFQGLSTATQESIVKWSLVAAAIGPALAVFGRLVTILGSAIGWIKSFGSALSTAGTFLASLSAGTWAWVGAIGAVIAIVPVIIDHWSGLMDWFEGFGQTLAGLFESTATLIGGFFRRAFNAILDLAGRFVTSVLGLVRDAASLAAPYNDQAKQVKNALDGIIRSTKSWRKQQTKDVRAAEKQIRTAWKNIKDSGMDAWEGIKDGASGAASAVRETYGGLFTWMQNAWQSVQSSFSLSRAAPGGAGGGAGPGGGGREGAQAAGPSRLNAGRGLNQMISDATLADMDTSAQKVQRLRRKFGQASSASSTFGNIARGAIRRIQRGLTRSLQAIRGVITGTKTMGDVFRSIGRTIVSALVGIIAKLTAAAALVTALNAIPGGSAVLSAADAASGVGGLLGFAEGGIATSPVIGMLAEGGQSEAVIPLDRLESMMGGGGMEGGTATASVTMDELRWRFEQSQSLQER